MEGEWCWKVRELCKMMMTKQRFQVWFEKMEMPQGEHAVEF